MPIVPIVIASAVLLGLLVAAVGPALRLAENRVAGDDGEIDGFVPLEWERVAVSRVTKRRFAPSATSQVASDAASKRQVA